MNIQAEKLEVMRLIIETDNPNIITSIKNIFKKSVKADFWETLSQEQQDDILKGIDEIENGEVVNYEDVMKKHR